ncbi:hypothetical protein K1719_001641 [Acacia pycnantha]|nr:hypothetical protein K1719_001641 [Acacia pycnantha]
MGELIARRDSQKKRLHVEFDENMNPEDWREFVASRQNPEFLETSQANRERQAKNNPPASSSSQKWKAARMKGDKYINEDVAAVASKIDSLEQQSSQGSFTPVHGRHFVDGNWEAGLPNAVRGSECRKIFLTTFTFV